MHSADTPETIINLEKLTDLNNSKNSFANSKALFGRTCERCCIRT